jgi:molybdopterin/thiamine biosynthesis adenylyltransferase
VPETPCLRCVFPEDPPPAGTFPVVGAAPGVIGCLQTMEVLKYLVGLGQNLKGRLLFFSGEETAFYSFEQSRDPNCPVCSRFHT